MKKLCLIFLFFLSFGFSQSSGDKNKKATFLVSGVCDMCKNRIDIGTVKIKGVKYANWDLVSNNLSIIYNSNKINLDSIQKQIAALGHDTGKHKAPEKVYNSLPECCFYKTIEPH